LAAITGGFELHARRQDRRDHNLDVLTDVVLGVQEAKHRGAASRDMFMIVTHDARSMPAVMEKEVFDVFNQARRPLFERHRPRTGNGKSATGSVAADTGGFRPGYTQLLR